MKNTKIKLSDLIELGTFKVESDKLMVSDPCYDKKTWCKVTLKNAKKGTWKGAIIVKDVSDGWGNRVKYLYAVHEKHKFLGTKWLKGEGTLGVDSGQLGIYDYGQYHGGEDDYGEDGWYDANCKLTNGFGGVLENGVVSRSGYGDGTYPHWIRKNSKGEIVAVKVKFV